MDEKTVRSHDRLTAEALRCLLEQTGFSEPLFVSDSVVASSSRTGSGAPVPSENQRSGGLVRGSGGRGGGVFLPFLSRDQAVEVERIRESPVLSSSSSSLLSPFHSQVLHRVASYLDINTTDFRYTCNDLSQGHCSVEDVTAIATVLCFFQLIVYVPHSLLVDGGGQDYRKGRRMHRPLPVYTSTALQIGLLDNPNVPR